MKFIKEYNQFILEEVSKNEPIPEIIGIGYPLKNLTKRHIIDLYFKMGIQDLLQYTNSCDQQSIELQPCGVCNGCRERDWGLEVLDE